MILMAAIDDKNGLLFQGRRQSRDRVLMQQILSRTADSLLWIAPYSAALFGQAPRLRVSKRFLDEAGPGEYCFVENCSVAPYADRVEQIILYRWNRRYPGDLFFDIDVTNGRWRLASSRSFAGSSHEAITEEVYLRA